MGKRLRECPCHNFPYTNLHGWSKCPQLAGHAAVGKCDRVGGQGAAAAENVSPECRWMGEQTDVGRIYSLVEFYVEVGKNKFGIQLL